MSIRITRPGRWLRDAGVTTKVLASVGLAIAVGVGVGATGLASLSSSADRTTELYEKNTEGARLAQEARYQYAAFRLGADAVQTAASDDARTQAISDRDNARDAMAQAAQAASALAPSGSPEKAVAARVVDDVEQYTAITQQLDALAASGDFAQLNELVQTQASPLSQQLVKDLENLAAVESRQAAESAAAAREAYASTRTVLIAVLLAGSLLAAGAAVVVARAIRRGLVSVQRVAEGLAAGDLTSSTGIDQDDEVGRMARALDAAQS